MQNLAGQPVVSPGCERGLALKQAQRLLLCLFVCSFLARQSPVGQGLLIHEVSRSHTTTRHSRQDFSGRVISLSQRPLPDSTQHSQQTDIHAPGGFRTHNLSRQAATDPRLRPSGHWDRQRLVLYMLKIRGNVILHIAKTTGECGIFCHFGSMVTSVYVKLNPILPQQKQQAARRRLFSPANWTYIQRTNQ